MRPGNLHRIRLGFHKQSDGTPVKNLPVALYIEYRSETEDGTPITGKEILGSFESNFAGYLSVPIFIPRHAETLVASPAFAPATTFDITDAAVRIDPEDPDTDVTAVINPVIIPDELVTAISSRLQPQPSILDPTPNDFRLSPGSFGTSDEAVIGEAGCPTFLPSEAAERTFRFAEIVTQPDGTFLQSPQLDPTHGLIYSLKPSVPERRLLPLPGKERLWRSLRSRLDIDTTPYWRRGALIEYEISWSPVRHALGEVIHSLALAPCESVNLAVIDWSREEEVRREDEVQLNEHLLHQQNRDRLVEETINGTIQQFQSGDTLMGGFAGVLGGMWDGFSFTNSHGAGGSVSSTEGRRSVATEGTQRIADTILQNSTSVRNLHSTVVKQANQAEREVIETRRVTNHNHCHALTVLYYQLLRQYRVRTRVKRIRDVILISQPLTEFDADTALHNEQILSDILLDPDLKNCFRALRKEQCAEAVLARRAVTGPQEENELGPLEFIFDIGEEGLARERLYIQLTTRRGGTVPLNPILERSSEEDPLPQNRQSIVTLTPDARVQWGEINSIQLALVYLGRDWPPSDPGLSILNLRVTTESGGDRWTLYDDSVGLDSLLRSQRPTRGEYRTFITLELQPIGPREPADVLNDDELCCKYRLLDHLNANAAFYTRHLWLHQDPGERAHFLSSFYFDSNQLLNQEDGAPSETGRLIDFTENRFLGIIGCDLVFPLNADVFSATLDRPTPEDRIVALPTHGVFAEAKLSECNACEKRDPTRFWNWQESPCSEPPAITGIEPRSRARSTDITPTPLPSPVLGVEAPPAAPTPGAFVEGILDVLKAQGIFDDLSGQEEVAGFLGKLVDAAKEVEQTRLQNAADIIRARSEESENDGETATGTSLDESSNTRRDGGEGMRPRRKSTKRSETRSETIEYPSPEELYDYGRALEEAPDFVPDEERRRIFRDQTSKTESAEELTDNPDCRYLAETVRIAILRNFPPQPIPEVAETDIHYEYINRLNAYRDVLYAYFRGRSGEVPLYEASTTSSEMRAGRPGAEQGLHDAETVWSSIPEDTRKELVANRNCEIVFEWDVAGEHFRNVLTVQNYLAIQLDNVIGVTLSRMIDAPGIPEHLLRLQQYARSGQLDRYRPVTYLAYPESISIFS